MIKRWRAARRTEMAWLHRYSISYSHLSDIGHDERVRRDDMGIFSRLVNRLNRNSQNICSPGNIEQSRTIEAAHLAFRGDAMQ